MFFFFLRITAIFSFIVCIFGLQIFEIMWSRKTRWLESSISFDSKETSSDLSSLSSDDSVHISFECVLRCKLMVTQVAIHYLIWERERERAWSRPITMISLVNNGEHWLTCSLLYIHSLNSPAGLTSQATDDISNLCSCSNCWEIMLTLEHLSTHPRLTECKFSNRAASAVVALQFSIGLN